MELRTIYSVFGALVLAVAASSCSTQTFLSRATGLPGVETGFEIHPAPEPAPRLLLAQGSSRSPNASAAKLAAPVSKPNLAPPAPKLAAAPNPAAAPAPKLAAAPNPASAPAAKLAAEPNSSANPAPAPKHAFFPRLGLTSSTSESARAKAIRESAPRNFVVRTTAYSHRRATVGSSVATMRPGIR